MFLFKSCPPPPCFPAQVVYDDAVFEKLWALMQPRPNGSASNVSTNAAALAAALSYDPALVDEDTGIYAAPYSPSTSVLAKKYGLGLRKTGINFQIGEWSGEAMR
jgi:hypothetical protein